MKNKKVVVSGYFDPLHEGHFDYLKRASKFGKLIVIVNNDEQTLNKKGYIFIKAKDRAKIIRSLSFVHRVVISIDKDRSVCKTLAKIKPDIFANGGDRFKSNIPEVEVCEKYGIKMKDGLGKKVNNSSSLHRELFRKIERIEKPWGYEVIIAKTEKYAGKLLIINPGGKLSLQYHERKLETIYVLKGKIDIQIGKDKFTLGKKDTYEIRPNTIHRFSSKVKTILIEVSTPELSDVVRIEDIYGRN